MPLLQRSKNMNSIRTELQLSILSRTNPILFIFTSYIMDPPVPYFYIYCLGFICLSYFTSEFSIFCPIYLSPFDLGLDVEYIINLSLCISIPFYTFKYLHVLCFPTNWNFGRLQPVHWRMKVRTCRKQAKSALYRYCNRCILRHKES
jgi:hypothetical protein